ncbi:hypothetical protein Tco_0901578 [Tanacetum coccineum]
MGLRICIQSIVFFSSGSGLTADSSVLTLTLAFLDFGLDFAQSFPFHAQFCHFGLVFCIDSILNLNTESTTLVDVPVTSNAEMPPSSATTPPPPPIPPIQPLKQTQVPTPTIVPSTSL